ncbi:MAG: hypothetical protein NC179_03810, partial [[Eubacterium] siraeum]|nr:hypothetical protein [[Eubacterium] siraeum]
NNMTLIDVSKGEKNVAFCDFGYTYEAQGVRGSGELVSYSQDATVTVELWASVENDDEPAKIAETSVRLVEAVPQQFAIQTELNAFSSLQLRIANADALVEDNTVILYDEAKAQERQVLIVSDLQDSAYLKNAIARAGKASVELMSTKKYEESPADGYGLYVFNGYAPKTLPKNAAIWLVDAVDGSGKGSGISFRDYEIPRDSTGSDSYFTAKYTDGTSSLEKSLTKDLIKREVAIRQYAKYGIPRKFTSVLSTGGDTVVATGLNDNNDRQVIFAFKIGDSDFGLSEDFIILVRNLIEYSFPSVIEQSAYSAGDVMSVNVVPGCESIVVTSPSGKSVTLDTIGADVCEVLLDEVGVFTVSVKRSGSENTDINAYASVPLAESNPVGEGTLTLGGDRQYKRSDGFYDDLLAFFIAIALLLLADWGIYCYEQYQLR